MTALQGEPANSALMRDLAHLYMRHGWFDRAVGPLARAVELDPGSAELHRDLSLALARAGMLHPDLSSARAEFLEMLEMWGQGC
jgi:Flp pilus assembly protein TadD